jgi:hypothetical protein
LDLIPEVEITRGFINLLSSKYEEYGFGMIAQQEFEIILETKAVCFYGCTAQAA